MERLPSTSLDGAASYSADLSLFRSAWKNLPFPGAKAPAELHQAAPTTAPPVQLLGTPQWFRVTLGGIVLPNAPLVTVTGAKTIVKTQVAGGDFTVKEIIGLDDYRVNIKGIGVREGQRDRGTNTLVPNDFPEEILRDLVALYQRNEALDVSCQLLSYFGISRLVVEDISFPGIPGSQGYLAYELNAVSDRSKLATLTRKR